MAGTMVCHRLCVKAFWHLSMFLSQPTICPHSLDPCAAQDYPETGGMLAIVRHV